MGHTERIQNCVFCMPAAAGVVKVGGRVRAGAGDAVWWCRERLLRAGGVFGEVVQGGGGQGFQYAS
jgi:hypothetical protein